MTAKTAPKVTLWEFFQQLGKTYMYEWHSVVLRHYAGIDPPLVATMSSP